MAPLILSMALLPFVLVPNVHGDDSDLLELLRAGHKQARESIASLHARYETKTTQAGDPTEFLRTAEWWQLGTSLKWKEIQKGALAAARMKAVSNSPKSNTEIITEGSLIDGKISSMTHFVVDGKAQPPVANKATPESWLPPFVDVWTRAGFMLQENPRLSMLELLETKDAVKAVRYEEY